MTTTVLDSGDKHCPAGGLRVTSTSGDEYVCDGAVGLQGDAGLQGLAGNDGTPGSPGEQGFPGTAGIDGLSGAQGEMGFTGKEGLPGKTGAAGVDGAPGTIGAMGDRGAAGATGDKGDTGASGVQGSAGPRGADGISVTATALGIGDDSCPNGGVKYTTYDGDHFVCDGVAGPQGDAGKQGLAGIDGIPGWQGEQGFPGAAGMDGLPGPGGEMGPMGSPGMPGKSGIEGTSVYGSSLSTEDTQCNFLGGVKYSSIDGDQYVCNGAPGAAGDAGVQGVQGLAGAQGDAGLTGDTGAAGPRGPMGPAGLGVGTKVADSEGTVVGTLISYQPGGHMMGSQYPIYSVRDVDGRMLSLNALSGAFDTSSSGVNFYYLSADCTGQRYIQPQMGRGMAFAEWNAAAPGDPLYVWTGNLLTIIVLSVKSGESCYAQGYEMQAALVEQIGVVPSFAGPLDLQ